MTATADSGFELAVERYIAAPPASVRQIVPVGEFDL